MTQATQPLMFPPILAELHKLPFEHKDGDGIDFEPFQDFLDASKVESFLKEWTGNDEIKADNFAVFGRDSFGGLVGFWIIDTEKAVEDQPIIFLGLEGEHMVAANNLDDYLWLLAGNHGAREAHEFIHDHLPHDENFTRFAEQHSSSEKRPPSVIVREAFDTHIDRFSRWVNTVCR
ncbi:SMI1/KNR4 family protein [Pseudomonas fluorescens]|uniref:SMI1/KNR4 family protein n=1 Tax=Pseudomonas TaxID=286 RepID=UPI000F044CA1|nr:MULTISPECIES: SMI1/KNR4 family protein [Pseudomonas]MBD8088995.1 SMI1/KNR4 family protein [Pseudomonas fluorescens]MBD8615574.1 SMI1/KNR4 family protein [Pseudomonas putida]MBD8681774.1 SMI1/KNR4 family protein [Pseudomonas sp. CFBP 13719]